MSKASKESEVQEFFQFIYGEQHGQACLTRNDNHGNPTRDTWFTYPDQLEDMVAFCEKHSAETVYFTPTLMRGQSRRKPAVLKCSVVFGDADTMNLDDLKIEPSAVVHTSPGHTHVYWQITDELDPLEIEKVSRGVSQHHDRDSTGYDRGWASNKLLRVPGTMNLKYAEPFKVTVEYTGAQYTMNEMEKEYPKAWTGIAEFRDLPNAADMPSRKEAMQMAYTADVHELLTKEFTKGKGSEALWAAINAIIDAGGSDEAAFVLLQDSEVNKWRRDKANSQEADERLWEDILRARSKSQVQAADATLPEPTAVLAAPKITDEVFDFLTEEERANLHPTFVSNFVAWSSSKTRAPECFMEASGFTILSAIFADFGHLPMNWGDMPLNLWFMNLGRSTVDRKTTVKNHMISFLRSCGRVVEDADSGVVPYDYTMSADATIEGMSSYMLAHPNRSGVLARDEFQGFLAALSKNYMSGAKDALTDFYNGSINGRLRSTGDKKDVKSAKYSLSFYAMGIRNQVAEQLTTEDFRSGFLTRYIWAVPDVNAGLDLDINEGFEMRPREEGKDGTDHAKSVLLRQILDARDYWESFTEPLTPTTEPIWPTPEALDRIKTLRTDMSTVIRRFGKEEAQSSMDRLTQSVLKAAALLAMSEQKEEVSLDHVLSVISYAGDWFRNMLLMVEDVAASDWAATLDKVTGKLLENDGTMSAKKLYAAFKDEFKPREWSEIINALTDSGNVTLSAKSNSKEMEVSYVGAIAE